MKTWQECCDEVGYFTKFNPPEQKYFWWAYKDGKSEKFNSESEARLFSKNYEKVKDAYSKQAISVYWLDCRLLEEKAVALWYAALQEEYKNLPVSIFNLCYNKAYDDGHSNGYDSIAEKMEDLVDFVEEILKCKGNK